MQFHTLLDNRTEKIHVSPDSLKLSYDNMIALYMTNRDGKQPEVVFGLTSIETEVLRIAARIIFNCYMFAEYGDREGRKNEG